MIRTQKCLSIVLVFSMLLYLLPAMAYTSFAAAPSEQGVAMNALDALGFDTNLMPDGFDATSTDNPYGGTTATVNQVHELYTADKDTGKLYGDNQKLGETSSSFYNSVKAAPKAPTYDAYRAVAGDFTGDGLAGEVATVAANATGGVDLYLSDVTTTNSAVLENTKTLLPVSTVIGNKGRYDKEDFAKEPYQLQNYLQIAAGDFDGDGYDELAVYLPEQGNSRVAVYKLKVTSGSSADRWLQAENWELAWTYSLKESPYVSNMVSLTAGDMTGDGIDDLALTWGVYYGKDYKTKCQATVLHGSKSNKYLQISSFLPLTYSTSEIVRAALTFGDADGDSKDELVLGGQLENDIDAAEYNTRFLAIYEYSTETGFVRTSAENMNMIEKKNDNGQYPASEDQRYFSAPACVSNIACVKMDGIGTQEYIYLDSVLYQEKSGSFEIKVELDEAKDMRDERQYKDYPYYAEYNAIAADFNGDGKETIQVMQYFLPFDTKVSVRKYWWFFPIGWSTSDVSVPGAGFLKEIDPSITKSNSGQSATFAAGATLWGLPITTYKTDVGSALKLSYCAPDTDIDTSKIVYTGKHYMTYTDPKVLAVLSSPPYFGDLGHLDGGDSYVCNSETTYGVTKGSGSGSTKSSTISVGAYVSFEHEFTVFGVPVAKVEAEVEYTHGWTKETENVRNVEQTVTYGTFAGQDAVAFYSIPMEVYVYDSYVPVTTNGKVIYEKQTMTVNLPYPAQVKTLSLDSYEEIAANYKELPVISDKVLTHTVGDPSTYPTSTSGYNGVNMPNCDFSGVDYDSLGFNKQSLDITHEVSVSTSQSNAINTKVGAGPGCVVVGVTAGYEGGSGKITTSIEGNSFEGVIVNMPASAKNYGYNYAWKVFQYTYTNGDVSFPVVNYIVTGVTSPPKLPTDFSLNTEKTSDTSITLNWTCNDASVAGYQVYRHYDFPDGSGDYAVGDIIPGGVYNKQLSFTDKNLNPYTEYEYRIQAIGATMPYQSVLSDLLVARTKASSGEPTIFVSDKTITIYPDKPESVKVIVENNAEHVQAPLYQWQKNIDGNWKDISGAINSEFTFFASGSSDAGEYRCRINQMVGELAISAYSDIITVKYEKRQLIDFDVMNSISSNGRTALTATLENSSTDSGSIPTGNVTFEISGRDYYNAYTAAVVNGTATYDPIPTLPDGIYELSAYYSGSRIFESKTATSAQYLSGIKEGYWIDLNASTTYGNEIQKKVNKFMDNSGGTNNEDMTDSFQYKVMKEVTQRTFINNNWVYNTEMKEMPGWISNDTITAKEVGDYILVATATDAGTDGIKPTVSKPFSVTKRLITIQAPTLKEVANTPNAVHPNADTLQITKNSFAPWDSFASLGITVECRNTADRPVQIDNNTEPGNYTTIGLASQGKLSNYEVTWARGLYTLTGKTYEVKGIAKELLGKIVGSIQVISPTGHDNKGWSTKYQAGTEVIFMAAPLTGYKIDKWQINGADVTDVQNNSNMLVYTMKSESLEVSVSFKVPDNTLEFSGKNGTVICTDSTTLKSGTTVIKDAKYTFKAIPNQGYHFKEWWLISGNTTYPKGDIDKEGFHTYTLTMPGASTNLFAVFERDSYVLALGDHLEATYMNDHDNNSSTSDVAITVTNGASIPGDKVVTVKPTAGYQLSNQGKWYVDEIEYNNSPHYTFTMIKAMSIKADIELQHYTVNVQNENAGCEENQITVTIDGEETVPNAGAIENVAGGTQLVLKASPVYGYVFDKWVVNENGKESTSSDNVLTLPPLGNDLTVKAVFKDNESFVLDVTEDIHGALTYSINDGYKEDTITSSGEIHVFKGDKVIFTAIPDDDYMVGTWTIDGKETQTTAKTWTLNNICADSTVALTFTPMSYYTVDFSAGTNGAITAEMDDNINLNSGDRPGGGSRIVFTAVPDAGYMVESWLIRSNKTGDLIEAQTVFGTINVDKDYTIAGLSKDVEVFVTFKTERTHTVTISAINGIILTKFMPDDYGSESSVRNGAAAQFTITPDDGYRIKEVTAVDADGKDVNIDTITKASDNTWICTVNEVTSDLTITAEIVKPYKINLPTVTGGFVSPVINTANTGEDVTLTANPNKNYKFSTWKITKIEQVKPGEDVTIDITSNLISDSSISTVTFSMPAYDITITPSFTYVPPIDNGGGVGGGGGGSAVVVTTTGAIIGLEDISYSNGIATIKVKNEKIEFSEEASAKLVKDNATMDIVISGNGVHILIPAGTLLSSADLNKMLRGVTKFGTVIKFTDVQGNTSIVEFCVTINGILAFIADQVGTYETVDNIKTFRDTNNHWAKESIDFATSHELFSGTGNNYFSPNDSMTRAMFVTVLGRLDDAVSSSKPSFTDIADNAWYSQFVSWASTNNIVSGVGNGKFDPNASITREQLCVILAKYMAYADIKLKNVNDIATFTDSDSISSWAVDAVNMAQQTGLITGKPGNLFDPQGTATRAEVATILLKFVKAVIEK